MADAADDATVTRFSKCQEEYSIEDVNRLAFLRIMTLSRSLGCCRSKTWRITSRIGACQACLHQMCMFTDVCACEIHCREVNEACRCTCPDGIAPSKVSTSDDVCDDPFLISAKSVTLLSRPLLGRPNAYCIKCLFQIVINQQCEQICKPQSTQNLKAQS